MKTPFSVKKPATIKNNFAAELPDIWRSWQNFIVGKNRTPALEFFHFNLEKNLLELQSDIESGCYRHGGYQKFVIYDKKRREIRVASVRDRVVHRLLYDFLVKLYDRTFIFDLWSCRKSKGVTAAIERTQEFLRRNPRAYVWRADIKKFFDNIDHRILMSILQRKVKDQKLLQLLLEVIGRDRGRIGQLLSKGISIGNLTSQIFANIYLNDFDYFVKHELKVKYYLRYGDDFIIIAPDAEVLNR